MCETCGNPEMSLFFALWTLTSLFYFVLFLGFVFFLTQEIKLVIIYCHDVDDDYDHLLAVQGALLPACVCMKGAMTVWPNGGQCDEDNNIRSVCVIDTILNVSFLSMRDLWEINCVRACVCLCGLAFEHVSALVRGVNRWLSDSLHLTERMCVCVHTCVCLYGCVCVLSGSCDI